MLDLSEEPIEENLDISTKYFERMAKMGMTLEIELGIKDVNNLCQEHYFQCLEQGVKAQSARRAIPQGMNTDIWVKFDREGYKNFIELRTDSHAQTEIRELANHMLGFSRHILELQENSN